MELLLGYYLDQFKDAPRCSLYDRRKRKQMVEYISTMIQGCAANDDNVQETCKEAVSTLVRYHKKAKTANGTVCMMGKYHNILYVAMKLCYLWQLKDHETVALVLHEIYSCERTFERIFIGAIFGTKAPHYIAGWKSDFDDQEENIRGLVYFLDKANYARLELPFDVGGEIKLFRFIDLPIESCGKTSATKLSVQLGLPDRLLILLRFGALTVNDKDVVTVYDHILNRLMEFNHCYPYNLVACLQLLLRVIPMVKICLPEAANMITKDSVIERYGDLVDDGLLPLSRCGFRPPELKHLSRCTIRRKLWENFQLPTGIRMLPLPVTLHRYLDILED
ncbi:uncharacterized protein LOC132704905 isoform X2 [Cylas formicarius]|uniref:uncharacterized protein LOC132704905 isoform X2 n=1 Tax=Cylas formicarius TaxID=197179 RepID=UPI0029585B2D|nr:uncharacterized protein LOC132704905 isoform X2 [Cylas formicarius]